MNPSPQSVGIDLKERTASQSTGRFQPSDTALMGSKLALPGALDV